MKNINVESKDIQDDLIELVGCHYIGNIEIEAENTAMSRVNVQHKGKSSTYLAPCHALNQFRGDDARGFLYEHEFDDGVYMLMSSHNRGHEHVSYVRMNDSLHALLFKKYIKLK